MSDATLSPPERFLQKDIDEQRFEPLKGFIKCAGQRHESVHEPQFLKRNVNRSGESNLGPSAYQPSASPLGQAGS